MSGQSDGAAETMAEGLGAVCGGCGGDVHFFCCPIHHWAVASMCLGDCQATYAVSRACKECYWPRARPSE